jgi:hypothetical protein
MSQTLRKFLPEDEKRLRELMVEKDQIDEADRKLQEGMPEFSRIDALVDFVYSHRDNAYEAGDEESVQKWEQIIGELKKRQLQAIGHDKD